MRLSRKSDLGLAFLVRLAERPLGNYVSVKSIAQAGGLPPRLLEQVALKLRAHGLVKSRSGRRGGYCLARRPARITVWEIVTALEEEVRLTHCLAKAASSARCAQLGRCEMRYGLQRLQAEVEKLLRRWRLADLLAQHPSAFFAYARRKKRNF
jgi:Rrf2 family protein